LSLAFSEDPACYWEEHCSNGIDAQHRFDSKYGDEDLSGICSGYKDVNWGIFVYFFLGLLLLIGCWIGFSWIDQLRGNI
jgi:hypothetical protein